MYVKSGGGKFNIKLIIKNFYIVCTVHRNQLYKQTNKVHILYVFILQFLSSSACFERPFHSSSGVHDLLYLQLCTNHANVSLDTFAWFVQKVYLVVCLYNKIFPRSRLYFGG